MLSSRPDINLLAETGGKDATIVTAMADRDQAIKNVMHSAFGHSGQKCSATSLLILEQEVYDDPAFKKALCDAVSSLHVGSARDLATRVGPLVVPPSGALERGLKELEPGESWAVVPHCVGDNPGLYSPAVKWDVKPGSFTHMTELFGPVLAVMRARDLDHAIDLVNQTGYGLTSGIESLDEREQARWRERIRAGNLYINRVTTGAVVLRQPFGGMGKSAFGPGIKAGGPNYVAQLMNFTDKAPHGRPVPGRDSRFASLVAALGGENENDSDAVCLLAALASYEDAWQSEFSREHDHFKLLGQHNIRRYLPVGKLMIRVGERADAYKVIAAMAAAWIAGNQVMISLHHEVNPVIEALLAKCARALDGKVTLARHSEQEILQLIEDQAIRRLRMLGEVASNALLLAAARHYVYVARTPLLASGRVELLWYLMEQSISDNYHRYGNLGEHGAEGRAEVL
jgi:RHH-type proline utilization regulon transcriptional repressor/proline dehydrogenase/delta 1-pyrroline-5-carboxylate dehydrogenase